MFVLNRDLENERELELDWKNLAPESVAACQTLTGDALKAFNTFDAPRRVAPQESDAPKPGRSMTLKLPAGSYTVLSLKLG